MDAMSVIDAVGIFGVVVFAVSGALAAGRHRMDPIGFIMLPRHWPVRLCWRYWSERGCPKISQRSSDF